VKRTFSNPLIGDVATFVKYAHEAGSTDTVVEIDLRPGGGNGLHYHRSFDEHFECLEGELGIQVGKKVLTLQPGEKATARRNELHRFFNPTDKPIRFRVTLNPGSPGFEQTIKIAYGLASDGLTNASGVPKKFWQMGVVVDLSDTNVPGIFTLLQPLLRWSARRARANGKFDRELKHYTE